MTAIGLIICSIYALAGFSAFVAFLVLGNYPASVWAFATGIISVLTVQLRWLKFKNRLDHWYTEKELSPLAFVGFVCFTLGAMGVSYHTAIEVMLKKPIIPINQSEVIPIIWAFMTAKCGIILMCTARRYAKMDGSTERSDLISPHSPGDEEEQRAEDVPSNGP